MLRNFQKLVLIFRALGFNVELFDERENLNEFCDIWVEISKNNLMFQVWKFGYLINGVMYPYEVHFFKNGELIDDTFVSSSEFDLVGLIYDVIEHK